MSFYQSYITNSGGSYMKVGNKKPKTMRYLSSRQAIGSRGKKVKERGLDFLEKDGKLQYFRRYPKTKKQKKSKNKKKKGNTNRRTNRKTNRKTRRNRSRRKKGGMEGGSDADERSERPESRGSREVRMLTEGGGPVAGEEADAIIDETLRELQVRFDTPVDRKLTSDQIATIKILPIFVSVPSKVHDNFISVIDIIAGMQLHHLEIQTPTKIEIREAQTQAVEVWKHLKDEESEVHWETLETYIRDVYMSESE